MAMDMGKSFRNILIGMVLGIGIGTFFLGPLLSAVMS
jgi:hypothetical protein